MTEWILCEEKQPKNFESVLLCLVDKRTGTEHDYFYVSATYENGGYKPDFYSDDDFCYVKPYAWTPLPQPFET